MAVTVVSVELVGDGTRGAVTIESDAKGFPNQIEELGNATSRGFVIQAAVKAGIKGLPGISRTVDKAYPVNSQGEAIENLKDADGNLLPPQSPRCQPAVYRARYEVTARQ